MLIFITQRREKNRHGDPIDVLEANYVKYFESHDVTLLPLPNSAQTVQRYFEEFSPAGLVLSGGNDIDPTLYGGKSSSETGVSQERDAAETQALQLATTRRLPVLGICRGLQFINVFFKGKLSKNMSSTNHVATTHPLTIKEERAQKLIGNKILVNSYHGQIVTAEDLASELKVFAESSDGMIEGVYHPDLPIGAIMWHPERLSPEPGSDRKVIQAFLNKKLYWGI